MNQKEKFKHSLDMLSEILDGIKEHQAILDANTTTLETMHSQMFEILEVLDLRMKSLTKTQAELSARVWKLEKR